MPRVRIKKMPSKYSNVPQFDAVGEFVKKKGGPTKGKGNVTHTASKSDQNYPFQDGQGQMNDSNQGFYQDMGGIISKMHVPDMDGNMYPGGGPINQMSYGSYSPARSFEKYYQSSFKKGGNWIQGAVNPAHKGYCTPETKSTCTPKRKAFAETMKKHHGFHKKDRGGVIYPFGHVDQDSPRFEDFVKGQYDEEYDRGGVIYPFGHQEQDFNHFANFVKGQYDEEYDRGGVIYPFGHVDEDSPRFDGYTTGLYGSQQGAYARGGLHDQNLIGNITRHPRHADSDMNEGLKKGGWLKGAVNPKHKGYCTPMTKSTCTGHRRAFALMMKKKHGFHDRGGVIYPIGGGGGGVGNAHDEPLFKKGGRFKPGGPSTDLNVTSNHGISDYNPYVYFKNKNWYITSNPEDQSITSSVKPIDRDAANIEAEKGEYIAKPGLTGLYKIGGKKHSQGGTPLYAEGGSFVFSNDPQLSFNKRDRENFGFKDPSSMSKSDNTPAKVLGREIKSKDYNSYIATLESPDTDRIAKMTAGLMLEKLQQKLGQIAYLQEAKKGEKAPDFSQGTAPVAQPQFHDIDERMDEYAYGGMYPDGGLIDPRTGLPIDPSDAYPGGRTTLGRMTPTGLANNFNYPGGVNGLIKNWQGVGIDMTNMNSRQAQGAMYDWAVQNNPGLVRNMWSQYGDTNQGRNLRGNMYDFDDLPDNALDTLRSHYTDGLLGARVFSPTIGRTPQVGLPPLAQTTTPPNVTAPSPVAPNQPGQQNPALPTLPYQIKGQMTDAQLAHLGYLGLQAFNINRYYPKREQVSLPQVRMDQVNAQPFLNQINNQAYESRQLAALNPRTANLVGSNIRGASVDQLNQTNGNVANQNVLIGNQQNQFNTQQATQQVMANSQFDNNYYNQVQATNQNFDNERRFAGNQFYSTLNSYKSQNDQLAWQLASIGRYGNRIVTDPKTGQQFNLPTPIYSLNPNGAINFNSDVANLNIATGRNRINTPQEINQMYQMFKNSGWDERTIRGAIDSIVRARGTATQGQGAFYANPYSGPGQ